MDDGVLEALKLAQANEARITALLGTGLGGSNRDIIVALSSDESAQVYALIADIIEKR